MDFDNMTALLSAHAFPSLERLATTPIGAVLWRRPVQGLSDQHVWIEHLGGEWFAGVESDGQVQLAAVWSDDGDAGRPGTLREVGGALAPQLHADLTPEQRTARIWSFLSGQSGGLVIDVAISKPELDAALACAGDTAPRGAAGVIAYLNDERRALLRSCLT